MEQYTNLCREAAKKIGYDLDIPIIINKRFTKTLGRYDGSKIEVAEYLLKNGTEDQIKQVLLHELAHYLCHKKYNERCGHDNRFKNMCKELNISTDTKSNFTVHNNHKYIIYCSKCKKIIGYRDRQCNLTKYPDLYLSKCCNADLEVIKNEM